MDFYTGLISLRFDYCLPYTMTKILFYLFAIIAVGTGLSVVFVQTAVNSAVSMIFSLLAVAGLYFLLRAYFLAALQVLVRAFAVNLLKELLTPRYSINREKGVCPAKKVNLDLKYPNI